MPKLTPHDIWNMSSAELSALLDSKHLKPTSDTIHFYTPSFSQTSNSAFPTISITGNRCALNCRHCNKKVLKTMQSATTATELWKLGERLKHEGSRGVLVSGGCLPDGSVPLDGFAEVLGRFKRELGFTVFVHSGLVNGETAGALKEAEVDAALIDVIGSQQTITEILNLKATPQRYTDSLKALQQAKLRVVPHVIVGLNRGQLDGELDALQAAAQIKPSAVVIIAFMPIPNTEMAQTHPPTPLDIARVTATARNIFPTVPLALGCMRPKGSHRSETDVLALKAGVDAVAFPIKEAVAFSKKGGYKTASSPFCCAQILLDAT